jgi:serine/threonine-protein kinase HipA
MSSLDVWLGSARVGRLELGVDRRWVFTFDEAHLADPDRHVLSQAFEDRPGRRVRGFLGLPNFFANLLPEGALREMILRSAGVSKGDEAGLLAFVGGDLPGAVRISAPGAEASPSSAEAEEASAQEVDQLHRTRAEALKFSLAGVQLKFSVLRDADSLTLPAQSGGGDWLVKLPDRRFSAVPLNEASLLQWAGQIGIEVPEHQLYPVERIVGLPGELDLAEPLCLAVQRYDRTTTGMRVHQEDFAQALDVHPEDKYRGGSVEKVVALGYRLLGEEGLRDLVRRLVFVVLSGNGDAHLKNWSLVYPDGRAAKLSPAYDLVFTRAYLPSDGLALPFWGKKGFEKVLVGDFRKLAQRIGHEEAEMAAWVEEDATRIREAWPGVCEAAPMLPAHKVALEAHLGAMRL